MIVLHGTLFGGLFRLRPAEHPPYVAVGLVVWSRLGSLVSDGCRALLEWRGFAHQAHRRLEALADGVGIPVVAAQDRELLRRLTTGMRLETAGVRSRRARGGVRWRLTRCLRRTAPGAGRSQRRRMR